MSVLVGKEAPDFTAVAVMPDNTFDENFNLRDYTKGKIAVLFFWPADFTFVCPSEIIAFNNRMEEFKKRNVAVVGCSVDSQFVHLTWKNTPVENGGVGNVRFPMVSDLGGDICRKYDILSPAKLAYRATFLIDQEGKVIHQIVNELSIGRNIDDLIRTIDALMFTQEHGDVCPANWKKGQEAIKPTKEGIADFLKNNAEKL